MCAVRRIAIFSAPVGVVLLVLVLPQLILPGIAADRIKDRLGHRGKVESVDVSAFPAIELLWHHADTVKVRMDTYSAGLSDLTSDLAKTADAGSLDASVGLLDTGLLKLHDATLRKRGSQLTGAARVTEADLSAALPILSNVQPVASDAGGLTFRGTASLLGISATVDATLSVQNGKLVITPDVPFGGLATLQVFSDPRVQVSSVSAAPTPDGFSVTAQARLK